MENCKQNSNHVSKGPKAFSAETKFPSNDPMTHYKHMCRTSDVNKCVSLYTVSQTITRKHLIIDKWQVIQRYNDLPHH